ncbi:Tfp pilus assembly protein PilF [Nitrosomonas sp. Nm51]|uniref:tetratricopeptide repeat protein n=1 Tax=Nitrosomonas sp. Nm51 TaxID=133720 RepID=UPI0008C6D45A|nr:hypothetical protein [Nitrosomonas sp. Nm51]SER14875.1 Tfp pilus assembly protein PilF [Nitrosomonas sp. Nm51]
MIQHISISYVTAAFPTGFGTPGYVAHLFILSLIVSGQMLFTATPYAAPYIPDNDAVVLQKLPASGNAGMQTLGRLRNALSKSPADLTLATEFARGYLQMGRIMADPRYDGYAQAALKPWWDMHQPPPEVLVLRAIVRQRQHDFVQALDDLNRALQMQPVNVQAWLTQAAIHQVRGDYRAAYRSCMPLLRLSSNLLATACIASVSSLNGRAHESYRILQKAIEQAPAAAPQEKRWALTILAETAARLEKYHEAERYFRAALAGERHDHYLLGAYSDFLLDRNRPEDVLDLLKKTTQSDGLLLRLALAARKVNAPELDIYIETLKARFAATRLRDETRHLREDARFTLNLLRRPERALKLAVDNWRTQREPRDARILLEAALQHGGRAAAQPVIDWIRSVNLEDSQLNKLMEQLS